MGLASSISTASILCTVALVLSLLPEVYAGQLFPWHPILMGLGFLGLMCEGMIAAYRFRGTDGPPRVVAIQNHMWVQVAATVSIALGFWAIYYNKVRFLLLLLAFNKRNKQTTQRRHPQSLTRSLHLYTHTHTKKMNSIYTESSIIKACMGK